MFKIVRKKTVAKFTLWFLIATFVIWGAGAAVTRRKTSSNYAGRIFGKRVSWEDYSKNLTAVRIQGMLRYGDRFKEVEGLLNLQDQAWDRLILLTEAKRNRLSTKDSDVVGTIQNMSLFQRNGVFDNRTYQTIMQYAFGIEPRIFEEQMRDTLSITKLIQKVTDQITITDEEVEKSYLKQNQKVWVSYILIEPKEFIARISLQEGQLKEFYEKNKQTFLKPQQVNIEYIGINFSDIEPDMVVTEQEILDYYNSNQDEFKTKDKDGKEALQSLEEAGEFIKKKLITTKTVQAAEDISEKISKVLVDTPDFKEIAKDFPVTIKQTGLFGAQDMVPEIGFSYPFINTAFSLKENQISDSVKTQKGIYFLKLKETRPPYTMSFDEAKDLVKEVLIQDEALALAKKDAEELNNRIKQLLSDRPNTSLKEIAASLNRNIKTASAITQDSYIDGLGPAEEVIDTLFNLKTGQLSEPVQTQKGFCILTVDDAEPIDEEKFNKEKDTFKTQMLSQKKIEHFNNWFSALKQKANLSEALTYGTK